MKFKNKKVLVTGGLGFIGSSLAIRLISEGADVTVIDAMIPEYGGNLFNIDPVKQKVKINIADILNEQIMTQLVKDKDYIFHLAGQVSHVKSLTDPFPDIEINIKGTALLLELCKKHNKDIKIVRAGTRGQYGNAKLLPVNEEAPTNPKGIYEISQLTAEKMMSVYNDIHGIKSVQLRLTNIYGPRSQMKSSHFGVVNWFIRLAMDGEMINVFGDGKIKRDFVYIDDCIEAMIVTALEETCVGEIFNVGNDEPTNFMELVNVLCELKKDCQWKFTPFSPERAAQEPGDFYSDITKIKSYTGWEPKTGLKDGVQKTIDYYTKYKTEYWN
ncbi:NAD-dependent epimerase/dehydratase family protein [soil metagenome]